MGTKASQATLEDLGDQAIRLLRRHHTASVGDRTRILRELADTIVCIREHFTRADGSPDWKGRSYAYRVYVKDIYERAHYSKAEMHTVQAAVRYHLGATLRDRLDEETLKEYKLVPWTPRERSRDHRANKAATLNALTSRELRGGALLAITAAYSVLSGLDDASLDEMDDRTRLVAEASLRDIERRVGQLLRRVDAGK